MLTKDRLPRVEDTILITGETGVGKSSLAKWIHSKSERKKSNFIQLNIASISEQLFESELFGHKKGSFTGALSDKVGFCEKVGAGTLFLDEIGDLSLELQKKILTLVDEGIYYPVGSTETKKFRGKLIFATHKDLEQQVSDGLFRKDLYYRLFTFQYELKPLRLKTNKEELIDKAIKLEAAQRESSFFVTRCVRDMLYKYDYPGNFRELKQLIKYLFFVSNGEINKACLPKWINTNKKFKKDSDNYYDALEEFEKSFFVEKLKKYKGKINFTAENINISKVTLISKVKKYDINMAQLKMEIFNGI